MSEPTARSWLYVAATARLRDLAAAERAVEKASAVRRSLPPGSSRAKVTTANARWATKCEARDRAIGVACAALRAAGLDSGSAES